LAVLTLSFHNLSPKYFVKLVNLQVVTEETENSALGIKKVLDKRVGGLIKSKSGEVASIRIQQDCQHFINRGERVYGEVWNGW
jgi:hypothetical protein